jgi:hypothetical protein
MSALTDRLMPGCVDIAARRAHLLWAAEHMETEEDGRLVDRVLARSLHDEYAYNITYTADFDALFRQLCELVKDADWIAAKADDSLIDHDVLYSHGRDAAYEDAQARNDQDIVDLLAQIVPSPVDAEVTA